MKNNQKSITALGAIAVASLISVGSLSAATTDSKDGMTTTTTTCANKPVDDGLPMLATGVQELSLSGHIDWNGKPQYNLGASYGRFITPNWMLGVSGALQRVSSSNVYDAGVFVEYDLLTNTKWVPFARANTGYQFARNGNNSAIRYSDGMYVGGEVGVKYFMRSNMAISLSTTGSWVVTGSGKSNGFSNGVDLGLKWYY
jgi:hypothetical protein